MKYRKKPIVIEAVQFKGHNLKEIEQFAKEKCMMARFSGTECTGIGIDTLEGCMNASIGDYIIKGVDGEFYPCKPGIFEKTYEVEEGIQKVGRLIDADALIKAMKKTEEEYENMEICPSWFTALRVIKEQPTAYDVEKVVEELKEISVIYCEEYKQREGSLYLQDAVEIVKAGGEK